LLGAIAGAHGVRGEVKIKSFTADPRKIGGYGPVEDESGARRFKVKVRGLAGGLVIARLAEVPPQGSKTGSLEGATDQKDRWVEDRNAAEALKGLRLYVGRDKLPRPKRGEWYLADLIGLRAERMDGTAMGTVKSVQNYGAGDIVEVETEPGRTVFVPFTKRAVPEVDVEGGRLVIEPPVETEAKAEEEADANES
jgi:16S rRNA processing protein RimM